MYHAIDCTLGSHCTALGPAIASDQRVWRAREIKRPRGSWFKDIMAKKAGSEKQDATNIAALSRDFINNESKANNFIDILQFLEVIIFEHMCPDRLYYLWSRHSLIVDDPAYDILIPALLIG